MKRFTIVLALMIFPIQGLAADFAAEDSAPDFDHNRWGTVSKGILREFRAYISSFDDLDDDNGDGTPDAWGEPEWVAYEIKRTIEPCIETHERPSKWITDLELFDQGIMPDDSSYAYPSTFTKKRKDWFSRGHLAMKLHAERLGGAAAWNTHTFYNGVPQRQLFNAGIWQDLEDLTAAWAQEYGAVWIITGPIFADRAPNAFIGQPGEFPVAIPDALFKIVIKEGLSPNKPDVLAFIYPQVGAGYYMGKPYDHTRYMTSVDEIEKVTGIDFLTALPSSSEKTIEAQSVRELWPVQKKSFIKACSATDD